MGKIYAEFADGSMLDFDKGMFDSWCVYLTRPNLARHAPRDVQYFSQILHYSKAHSPETIYQDFVQVYNTTNKKINPNVLGCISQLSQKYGNDSLELEILFSILYGGMIAEENRAGTKLGKRVKRLGIHQLLFENFTPNDAANFSKGKNWREIDAECRKRGF